MDQRRRLSGVRIAGSAPGRIEQPGHPRRDEARQRPPEIDPAEDRERRHHHRDDGDDAVALFGWSIALK